MPNTFEDAALILRGLKERVDRGKEERSSSGEVNLVRSVTSTSLGVDTVATSTGDAASWRWGDSTWGFDEWGE